jgi:hypothetical protein
MDEVKDGRSVMREVVWGLVGVAVMVGMYVAFCAWLPMV